MCRHVILISTVVSTLSGLAHGLVGISWNVSNTPSSGLTDISFPISMPDAPHESGFYFAQQYSFGSSAMGYTGLQPRPDSDGQSIIHAVFSSFTKGSTTDDSNCSPGADGGDGVSCAVDVASSYVDSYVLSVAKAGDTSWNGTLIDTTTGVSTHIGSYSLPAGTANIQSSQVGFVEYYPWNSDASHSCAALPYTAVTFGTPYTKTPGAGDGALSDAYEYGDCVGKVDFQNHRPTPNEVKTSVGFE
ncbi:hypothetical protein NFIA_092810 [Paecilomyces variotii No. 5]|uniref:Uncharacterized protein n=1 Tax=Byssochlamys spectabilis (strain No. 5 / NBRC 109023) TaxID=1356009 RepID=V5I1E4_BYSSN|nr:hypothetical protein NFIA_092810 [Paecilomyces variotii No. 5]